MLGKLIRTQLGVLYVRDKYGVPPFSMIVCKEHVFSFPLLSATESKTVLSARKEKRLERMSTSGPLDAQMHRHCSWGAAG